MKMMSFENFKDYCRTCYINYEQLEDADNQKNVVEYVLSNIDPWFHMTDGYLYTLHTLGFELRYCKEGYVFYRVNKNICNQIDLNDCLLSINEQTPGEVFVKSSMSDDNINMKIKNIHGCIKNVSVKKPKMEHIFDSKIQFKSFDECTGYIKIDLFHNADISRLKAFLSEKKRIVIDLRSCTGGRINDMLNIASHFAYKNIQLCFEDNKGSVKVKTIYAQEDSDIIVRQIDFIIGSMTASSAEIFCLMIRSNYPGAIYGDKSMGKLLIQEFIGIEGVIVALPIYKLKKPQHLYGGIQANYDGECIVPDQKEYFYMPLLRRMELVKV